LGDASLPGAAQPVTVLQQRVTELLDLPALVRQSFSAAPGAAS
jgi:hypothetical protein